MSERNLDFVEQRNNVRKIATWPLNCVLGLQSFQPVQHLYNFTARTLCAITSVIPYAKSYQMSSYVDNTARLTRFRNFHDEII